MLLSTVLGSTLVMLDSTVVNVGLPAIGTDLGAGVAGRQWIVSSYLLTLSALLLLGGALGDRLGRRRIFLLGVLWFAVASLLCAVAPSLPLLILARGLQGVGGALLTPGSLAIIQSTFRPTDRARAIGAWSALTSIGIAIGPLLGGLLIDTLSWRWIFLINLPLAAVVVAAAVRHVPESRDPDALGRPDLPGAVLSVAALGGVTYAVIEAPGRGLGAAPVVASAVLGALAAVLFVVVERRVPQPMLPLTLFASRQFTAANLLCLLVYAALGGVSFLLVQHLQIVLGLPATAAGAAMLPVTLLMIVGSERAGALAQRIGPRVPLTVGPALLALGMAAMAPIGAGDPYVPDVLVPVLVFGVGLTITVAPVTATVLAAVEDRHSGIASGVNNAVSRVAQLLAVAALPVAAGLSGPAGGEVPAEAFAAGFDTAMLLAAGLALAGAVLAAATIRNDVLEPS